jgi:hypothetical protein
MEKNDSSGNESSDPYSSMGRSVSISVMHIDLSNKLIAKTEELKQKIIDTKQ